MNNLLILLAQSRTEAAIEIIFLLLVAGIIGYVTAWLYYKSVYEKKIKVINSEKHELSNRVATLNGEVFDQRNKLIEKDNEKDRLVLEVKALRALHAEAVHENDDMKIKNTRTEQLLYEKDEALVHIAQRRYLLDYKSFGTATEDEKDDLKMISGIGPFIEERLHALDIYTFRQISRFTARDIETIDDAIEYFSGRIVRDEWVAQAKELIHKEELRQELLTRIGARKNHIYFDRIGIASKEEADDLTEISGIGGWIKEKLNVLDIYTFKQISKFTNDDVHTVTETIEYFPGRIERDEWIIQAQELVRIAGRKRDLLNRIRERKEKIYFDRIGIGQKHLADNLTQINGIGLWIEERLNMLDIFTFEQISKLTAKDVETIMEVLELSPGYIDKDNWVSQARGLSRKQLLAV